MIVSMKDLHVHIITEEMRPEINIEEVWTKPMSHERKKRVRNEYF
jgi:hypothetical protein